MIDDALLAVFVFAHYFDKIIDVWFFCVCVFFFNVQMAVSGLSARRIAQNFWRLHDACALCDCKTGRSDM